MKFPSSAASSLSAGLVALRWLAGNTIRTVHADMVKMCLFYDSESGHARTDPIIDQTCASDHVHTVSLAYKLVVKLAASNKALTIVTLNAVFFPFTAM